MKKRILALLLVLMMSVALLPISALADSEIERSAGKPPVIEPIDKSDLTRFVRVNPVYADLITEQQLTAALAKRPDAQIAAIPGNDDPVPFSTIVEYTRYYLENRVPEFYVLFYAESAYQELCLDYDCAEFLLEEAMAETGVPTQGDYIRWNFFGYGGGFGTGSYQGKTLYYMELEIEYLSSAQDEQRAGEKINKVISSMGFTANTDAYTKVKKIYQYVCDNVAYDVKHVNDPSYLRMFSGCAAILDGTAVCQGYSTMMYRMLWTVGVPTRVVTSYDHAWNSVKVDGLYYFADTTWDEEQTPEHYNFFLRGTRDFYGHDPFDPQFDEYFFKVHKHADYSYVYAPGKFTDIKDHWATESISYVFNRGIMSGTGDTTFDPAGTVTRAMLAVMLYNLSGEPAVSGGNPFTDVPDTWYTTPIIWAYENGIVSGNGDGTFSPEDGITREQLAIMMANYAELCGKNITADYDLSKFVDADAVSPWALGCIKWACSVGLINGSDEDGILYLDPLGTATRCQIAVIFQNYCEIFQI